MTKTAKTKPATASDSQTIRDIPLSLLELSPLNPRRNVTAEEITALADSIRTVGLLQNLGGIKNDAGRLEIVAGGRRLRALWQIADEAGEDREKLGIPVRIAESESEARAWAATENAAREPLNPADEIRAYAAMSETGVLPQTIAKAFAVTVRHVKARLKLAALPDPILDVLGAGDMTLDVAGAYTVSDDPAHQLEIFEKLRGTWQEDNACQIRNMLTKDAADQDSRLARFVTREAYEAAGGAISEDLFGDDVYFLDGDLLARLAQEKLDGEKAIHLAAGWKWVETSFERPDGMYDLSRTSPARVEASEEEAARYDELAELMEGENASEEESAEFAALSEKLDREDYSTAQMGLAGVFLWIGYRGEIEAQYGCVKPEDHQAALDAGFCRPTRQISMTAAQEKKPLYSAALAEDMARIRSGAVQAALLTKPELALDLLAFALSAEAYGGAIPLGVRSDRAANLPKDGEGMALPDPLAQSIARMFSIGLTGKASPLAEAVAGLSPRTVWTPSEGFLKRLTGAQLDAIHAEIMGDAQPGFTKMKKGEKVGRLHRIFAGDSDIPPLTAEQKARASAWLPEGLASAPAIDKDSQAA